MKIIVLDRKTNIAYNVASREDNNMSYTRFPEEEFLKLSVAMQEYHGIFYELWNIGKPYFSDKIPTAAIAFNQTGRGIYFLINKDFWDGLTMHQKCFVMGHECLHVILNHGIRADCKIDARANKAMDVVVNHSLVDNFGFDREEFDPNNKYCWIDTVFKENSDKIKKQQSFEYYYSMIKKQPNDCEDGKGGDGTGGELVDDHQNFDDFSKTLKELSEKLNDKQKEGLKDFIKKHFPKEDKQQQNKAGNEKGGMDYLVPDNKPKRKKKWETVIKKWTQKFMNVGDKDIDQWAKVDRRYANLENDFFIPYEAEMEDKFTDLKRIQVWFFQDTSGSCSGFKDRFFAAAESLPPERFDVKMHCFDTEVYETTLKSRQLFGFGGTTFTCIEQYIQKYMKEHNTAYPKAVFVVTDGDGNRVEPEIPDRWHWFLSYKQLSCIPDKCKTYLLENFE